MSEKTYDNQPNLRLTVLKDHQAIAKAAAKRIAGRLREKPDMVLGLATGATMEPVYAELVRMHKDEGLDFSKARFFNLDHYKDLPTSDRNSYDSQLRKLLLSKVNAQESNIHLVQGANFSPDAYEAKIKAAGGIDIQLLGVGGEGHIGFNEVGSSINSRTREVTLSERTREDNGTYFNRPGEEVPVAAYTMGVGTILESREVIALANNPNKAWTVRNMMEPTGKSSQEITSLELTQLQHLNASATGAHLHMDALGAFFEAQRADTLAKAQPVEELPARALHAHKNVHFIVDEEAASMTRPTDLLQRSNLDKDAVETLLERFRPKMLALPQGGSIFLTAGFDFYDPKVMGLDEKFDVKNHVHVEALGRALKNATDVAVGAHQDDVEIMAGPQLLKTAADPKRQWLSIIMTDGAASKSILNECSTELTPKQLTDMRQREQREAAQMAGAPVIQMKYPSAVVNGHMGEGKKREAGYALGTLFAAMPDVENVFGHNPLDKHPTHIAVFAAQTAALRAAKPEKLKKVVGMEVWGGLTGLPEKMLEIFVVDQQEDLGRLEKIIQLFQSQILGQGRNYAAGTVDRMIGHAAYVSSPHLNNPPPGMVIGVDVSEFTRGTSNDMAGLVDDILKRAQDIKHGVAKHHGVVATPRLNEGYAGNILVGRNTARSVG